MRPKVDDAQNEMHAFGDSPSTVTRTTWRSSGRRAVLNEGTRISGGPDCSAVHWYGELDQPAGRQTDRNPTQPPRNLRPTERTSGATDFSVTPRKKMVELRGLEPLTPRLAERSEELKSSIDKKRRSATRGKKEHWTLPPRHLYCGKIHLRNPTLARQ